MAPVRIAPIASSRSRKPYAQAILLLATAFAALTGCASPQPQPDWAFFPTDRDRARVVHLKSFNRLDEIVSPARTGSWFGSAGTPSAFVTAPTGMTVRDDRLYICDAPRRRVHIWNLEDGTTGRIGDRDEQPLISPVDVELLPDGTIAIADTERGAIELYARDGTRLSTLRPPPGEAFRPVALASIGDEILAADAATHRIHRFGIGGEHRGTFGKQGREEGEFLFPTGIATHADSIWVTDMLGGKLQRFAAGGSFRESVGRRGNRYGNFAAPRGIAISRDGLLHIADAEAQRVQLRDAHGRLLLMVGADRPASGFLPLPVGVAVIDHPPPALMRLAPPGFDITSMFVVSNTAGDAKLALFAIGQFENGS